jgi:hypothetical protein
VAEATDRLGLNTVVLDASTAAEIEVAFATLKQQHVGAVLIGTTRLRFRARNASGARGQLQAAVHLVSP